MKGNEGSLIEEIDVVGRVKTEESTQPMRESRVGYIPSASLDKREEF